ncbi:MAG: hypothetical protein LBT24_00295 [Tannerella sp.]|jgi:hypothetical protein|nr:hypothetical protein [Tannerella sp.]
MNRQLLEDVHRYFAGKENPTQGEKDLLMRLNGELPYFQITSVHRDDLEFRGFDVSNVTDAQMETIADKMANAYTGNDVFWIDLDIIAAECAGVPWKPEKMRKDELIEKIQDTVDEYGAFSTADVDAEASPCIYSGEGITVLAEFFCEDNVTATTYNDKGVEIHSEFKPYMDLEQDVLCKIYELCLEWITRND